MPHPTSTQSDGIFGQLPSQQASSIMAQQKLLLQHRDVEYFYAYVAEAEFSSVGHWITLEPDKTLSLENLRGYYTTCFGIKYKKVVSDTQVENCYVRYQNGFFRFPAGLDMNNTRFIAYYYNDVNDVNAFMALADADDRGPGTVPTMDFEKTQKNDSTFLHRTMNNFDMANVLQCGAQSTPKSARAPAAIASLIENVSSTSDVIFNEKTIEVISVHDSQSIVTQKPPPPLCSPQYATTSTAVNPGPFGIKAKLGPSVSSTSDLECQGKQFKHYTRVKQEPISIDDSSLCQNDQKPVMVKVVTAPKSKNMLNRYQANRAQKPLNINEKTPLKITVKRQGRQTLRDTKIIKIEDEKGRTTALLTRRKCLGNSMAPRETNKRRYESDEDFQAQTVQKRRKFNLQPQQFHQPVEPTAIYDDYYRTLNILLVGFRTSPPVIHETTTYFSEFGVVTNLQLYTLENRNSIPELYAFMKIRTDNAVSLFADRHLYNGSVIYAIRVDGTRLPSRVSCKTCDYQGLNVAYLNYHIEGVAHQTRLQKRLKSLAGTAGNVYRDSYYRITYDELYVQYPNDAVQEIVRNNYWKREPNVIGDYRTAVVTQSNLLYKIEKGRDY
ncbi:uncharacterized protein LOC129733148 [Wyeomyia smithii]|uniref:uncharacterized protein LOC129733148 n=1 Tax=Wyeomyia smithii TaxID=174621 RepID=UPI002467F3D9|nr:uncharacterized protein LOC129733148 [Wyeomyia smithii]XP_055550739.1 uncharacterized protein LOC129733148 [Wyeomyia smithii]